MKARIAALLCFVFALTAVRGQDVEPTAIPFQGTLPGPVLADPIDPALKAP